MKLAIVTSKSLQSARPALEHCAYLGDSIHDLHAARDPAASGGSEL